MRRWGAGEELSMQDQAIAVVYGDIINLDYGAVAEFYGVEADEEEMTDV